MADKKPQITIDLTPEQKEQIKQATGADVEKLEVSAGDETLDPEELEERVAPALPIIKIVIKGTFVF